MRQVIVAMLIAVSTVTVASGQHHTYMKGTEVNADQGLFLAMPADNFPKQTAGPLTVIIQPPAVGGYGAVGPWQLTQPDAPFPVGVWLVNSASTAIRGTLQMKVIDKWRTVPSEPLTFELAPKGWRQLEFQVSFGRGTFNADYPVHAFAEFEYEGKRLTAD